MDLRRVLNLAGVLCWLSYVYGNESVPKYLIANPGRNPVAYEHNFMHDFNFPDVTYPTSLLDTCQPFYFNSNSNGLDSIVGPFSGDVKSNYISLYSHDNGHKVKDEVPLATNKCHLNDHIVIDPAKSEEIAIEKNESEDTSKLEIIRKNLRNFLENNDIDPELEEILSLLYSDEVDESNDLNTETGLNHNDSYEIEDKLSFKVMEQIILPLVEDSIENEPESIDYDKDNQFNTNDSNIDENTNNLILMDNLFTNLQIKNEPESIDYDKDNQFNMSESNIDENAHNLITMDNLLENLQIKNEPESIDYDKYNQFNMSESNIEENANNLIMMENLYANLQIKNEPESIDYDKYDQFNMNESNIDKKADNLIIIDDMYAKLQIQNLPTVNIPNTTNDTYSSLNYSYTSDIESDLELIKDDVSLLVNINNSNNSDEQENSIVEDDIDCHYNKTYADEQLTKPDATCNYTNNNNNIEHNITLPDDSHLNSHNNEQNTNDSMQDDNNQLNMKSTDRGDDYNEVEINNTMTIPKEAVIFDVVSKDGINLEKPLLDIVPSNLPVRLKINIEICKPDSIEKVDILEIEDILQPLKPTENNIVLRDINNGIENSDESESLPIEEITVLDEINDSDFINALSILLLDSLKNNPIEIIAPETTNLECDKPIEYPIKSRDDDFVNTLPEENPPTVPGFIYSYNNLNGQTNGYINPSEMKFINTSPLIDTLSPVNSHSIQEAIDTDNNNMTELVPIVDSMKDVQELVKPELLETYPLFYYPYNIAGFAPRLV